MTAEIVTMETSLAYLMKNYANYNLWANIRLVEWLKTQSLELLEKEVPSSFSGIKPTLVHIWATQRYWLSVLNKTSEERQDEFNGSLDEIFELLLGQSEEIVSFIESMTTVRMQSNTLIISPWFQCDFPNFEYVVQCMNHSTYHRGQVVTISHQLGLTGAPNTDYNFYNVRGK